MKYLKGLLYFFIITLVLFIIISTVHYFGFIPSNIIKHLNLAILIVAALISSIYVGRKSNSKGYLEGIKMGILLTVLLFLFSFLGFDKGVNTMKLILYLIIILSSVAGSIIGINRVSRENK